MGRTATRFYYPSQNSRKVIHVHPQDFIDYYELMQISPKAEPETIQRVFRLLAARYHPDNRQTGNTEIFIALNNAFAVLSDPTRRSEYDTLYERCKSQPLPIFQMKDFSDGMEGEANRRLGILCLLYNRRRINPDSSGMSILELESIMAIPREHLMFTLWYLKEKRFIRPDERSSDFVITAEGVDYVHLHLPKNRIVYDLVDSIQDRKADANSDGRSDDRPCRGESVDVCISGFRPRLIEYDTGAM